MIFDLRLKAAEILESKSTPERALWVEALRQSLSLAAQGDKKELAWIFSDSTKVKSFLWICSDACLDLHIVKPVRMILYDAHERSKLYWRLRSAKNRYNGYSFKKGKYEKR